MDGLNASWEKYGCNEHDAIIGMAYNTSSGGLTYWVNSNGVKYAGYEISSSAGLVGELNSGSVGVIAVIAPDRTFQITQSPGFLGASYPFYYDLLDEGGCEPHSCDPVAINTNKNKSVYGLNSKIHFNGSVLEKISISQKGNVSLDIVDLKGRVVKTFINEFKNAGEYNISFGFNELSNGTYIVNLKLNDELCTKKVAVFK